MGEFLPTPQNPRCVFLYIPSRFHARVLFAHVTWFGSKGFITYNFTVLKKFVSRRKASCGAARKYRAEASGDFHVPKKSTNWRSNPLVRNHVLPPIRRAYGAMSSVTPARFCRYFVNLCFLLRSFKKFFCIIPRCDKSIRIRTGQILEISSGTFHLLK